MNNLTNFERPKGKLHHFGRDTSGFPRREKWEIKQLYKKIWFLCSSNSHCYHPCFCSHNHIDYSINY